MSGVADWTLPAAVLAAASLAGCGTVEPPADSAGGEAEPDTVSSVIVIPSAARLDAVGSTVDLEAEARGPDGDPVAGVAFDWASAPEPVVTVDSSGTVTAEGRGGSEITASARGHEGYATVVVTPVARSLEVSPGEASLAAVGDTQRFEAAAEDRNGHPVERARVSWSSLDTAVAAVDADGVAVAREAGETGIVAAAGTAADTATLTVAGGSPD